MFFAIVFAQSCAKKYVGSFDNNYVSSSSNVVRGENFTDATTAGLATEKVDRKIIFDAYLSISVENPDAANIQMEQIAKKYNGYVSQSGTYSTIIRVESDKLNEAIGEISELGKLHSKSISGQDVTDEYMDYQIRLENAEKSRLRYLELLEKAENVQAALMVEKELERLNETIDLLKGKMSRIDHLSDFSTITVSIKEKKKPGLIGYVGLGLYYSVKWLFVRN
jgi:hypothetical protein